MKSKQKSAIWPYLGILACLFVLSVTAPRAWERRATKELGGKAVKHVAFQSPYASPDNLILEVHDRAELEPRTSLTEETRAAETLSVAAPALEPELTSESSTPEVLTSEILNTDQVQPQTAAGPVAIGSDEQHPVPANEPAGPMPESSGPMVVPTPSWPRDTVLPPAPEFAAEVREEPAAPAPLALEAPPAHEADPQAEPSTETATVNETPAEAAVETPAWPLPRVLLMQLTSLVQEDPQAIWAVRAAGLIHELCQQAGDPPAAAEALKQLRELVTNEASQPASDAALEAPTIRARYALSRWVDVWEAALALSERPLVEQSDVASDLEVSQSLTAVEQMTRKGVVGAAWRKYLDLETLRDSAQPDVSSDERRIAARRVLDRLEASQLTKAQKQFLEEPQVRQLKVALEGWAAQPIAADELLRHLEQYEFSGLTSDGRIVADDFRGLRWSAPEEAELLSTHLDTHYRNANLRIGVSGALMNRLIPQPERIDARVNDTVLNVPVRGRSSTFTELYVRLVPDPKRIRIGLEANGLVASDTLSTSGPATLRNKGQATFLVRKLLVLGPKGLSVWPAIAEADTNYNYLVSLETDFDGVPLVGSLVRNIARTQYDESKDEAIAESSQKIAVRALNQFDNEIDSRLVKAGEEMQQKQLATLKRLGLDLTPISFSTTEERIVTRARLGGPEQLGAHTPRPRAPSDSWFSLQLHQSALNNGLEQLDLEGRTFKLPELFAWIANKLGRPDLAHLDELPEDVTLTFADKDAVRLRAENGKVKVTLSLSKLTQGDLMWRNFQVYANYEPVSDGLDARLTRTGVIKLSQRKAEVLLRTIFSRVMSKNRDFRLLSETMTKDPRVKDLTVTQFEVEDGWIALAYSQRRVPSNVARKPKP